MKRLMNSLVVAHNKVEPRATTLTTLRSQSQLIVWQCKVPVGSLDSFSGKDPWIKACGQWENFLSTPEGAEHPYDHLGMAG